VSFDFYAIKEAFTGEIKFEQLHAQIFSKHFVNASFIT